MGDDDPITIVGAVVLGICVLLLIYSIAYLLPMLIKSFGGF